MRQALLLAAGLLVGGVALADEIKFQTPCRLLDTRNTTAGYVPAHTQLDIHVRLPIATDQGGDFNCGVSEVASGAILNVTAVGPSGTGHVKLWAYGTAEPTTSVLNVTAADTNNDGLIVQFGGGNAENLSLKGSVDAYYVVDVVGMVDPRPQYLVGTAMGVPCAGCLDVDTYEGLRINAFAPDRLIPTFYQDSIDASIAGACVHIDGIWRGPRSFEARSQIIIMNGPCD